MTLQEICVTVPDSEGQHHGRDAHLSAPADAHSTPDAHTHTQHLVLPAVNHIYIYVYTYIYIYFYYMHSECSTLVLICELLWCAATKPTAVCSRRGMLTS